MEKKRTRTIERIMQFIFKRICKAGPFLCQLYNALKSRRVKTAYSTAWADFLIISSSGRLSVRSGWFDKININEHQIKTGPHNLRKRMNLFSLLLSVLTSALCLFKPILLIVQGSHSEKVIWLNLKASFLASIGSPKTL